MSGNFRVHLVALGLLSLVATVIILFWAYPRLLIYLLLVIVAVLAYGALYLIVAAWMDPKRDAASEPPRPAPAASRDDAVTVPDVRPPTGARRAAAKTRKRSPTRKKTGKTSRKSTSRKRKPTQ